MPETDTENPKCKLISSDNVSGNQVELSQSSLARVSKISGGAEQSFNIPRIIFIWQTRKDKSGAAWATSRCQAIT